MNLCSYNSKTRNGRHVMPVHHGFFVLFQFCEDFIGTHALGKQLFQNGLCFCLFCFFCSFSICLCLFCFQFDNFLVDGFQLCFLGFQVSFQCIDIRSDGCDFGRECFSCRLLAASMPTTPIFSTRIVRIFKMTFTSADKKLAIA